MFLKILSFTLLLGSIFVETHTAKTRQNEILSLPDLITSLPNLTFPLSSRHFSGYLSSLNSTNLFYWFIESQSNPATDPLLLWLSGGPGCSSLFASFAEIGPILFHDNGTLISNEYAWNKKANLLFIETPAGTGFSYQTNATKYETNDNETAIINYHALKSFYSKFPQFVNRDFFMSGQSYAAHYIPQLGAQVLEHNFPPNLKGVFVGNGQIYQRLNDVLLSYYMKSKGFNNFSDTQSDFFSRKLWVYDINRECIATTPDPYIYVPETRSPVPPEPSKACLNHASASQYLNQPEVRRAIHVDANFETENWFLCSMMKNEYLNLTYLNYDYSYNSTAHYYETLLNSSVKVIFYNGDADAVCNYIATRIFVKGQNYLKLKALGEEETFKDANQTYGTIQRFEKNVTLVVFYNASHMVPIDEPRMALKLLNEELLGL